MKIPEWLRILCYNFTHYNITFLGRCLATFTKEMSTKKHQGEDFKGRSTEADILT